MADNFDPYLKWLGIAPEDQPPNHYRLLGVPLFIDDPDVIASAADRQMKHVRLFQTGRHAQLSQQLLNELAKAKVCLLNGDAKAAYDEQLKARSMSQRQIATAKPLPQPLPGPAKSAASAVRPVEAIPSLAVPTSTSRVSSRRSYSKRRKTSAVPIVAATAIGLVALVGIVIAFGLANNAEPTIAEPSHPEVQPAQRPVEPTPPASDAPQKSSTPIDRPAPQVAATDENEADEDPIQPDPIADMPAVETLDEPPPVEIASQVKRSPVPDDDSQKAALIVVRDVFKADIEQATMPDEKRAFAQRLIQAGLETEDDPTTKYVLLRVGRDLAVAAGDAELVIESIDTIAELYEVSPLEMKADALIKTADAVHASEGHAGFISAGRTVVQQLAAADEFERAVHLSDLLLVSARTTEDIDLIKEIVAWNKELEANASAYEAVKRALAVMEVNRDDPEANLAVGKYYCFVKGDWDGGLPLLAKGSAADLKTAAEMELTNPTDADDQVKIGDTWWALADQQEELAKQRMLQRTAFWYLKARSRLTDALTKSKVEKRLAEIAAQPSPAWDSPDQIVSTMEISEEKWAGGAPLVKLISNSEGFAFLKSVAGKFAGAGEKVAAALNRDGFWYLVGHTQQPLAAGATIVRTKLRDKFKKGVTFYDWSSGSPPVKMIHRSEGFCFLSSIGGGFNGGGEEVRVHIGEDGYWYLSGRSGTPINARAAAIRTNEHGGFRAEIQEHTWHGTAVKMIHKDEGFCFLSGVTGGFEGFGESVWLKVGEDGYWYLSLHAHQPLGARATSIRFLR